LIASLALLGFYLLGLDSALLFDVDEGAFTEATREMLLSRDWGHTTLNGLDRFDKPIGVYWLQALSASLFGLNEFAFRLPSALSSWIASLALAFFVNEKWGHRAAFLAAVISATSLGPWAMARTATADALLGLFFVLIFLDLCRSIETRKIFYIRRLAIWIALGVLVKGPVALLVPVGSLIVYALITPADRAHVKSMFLDAWAWVLLISISMPWYLYAYLRHGQNFIDGFLLKHNVERFTGSLEGHSGSWSYFLIALPLLWMPWSVMWFKSLMDIGAQWKEPLLKFSWIWFAFVFVFFTFANTKLPHYLLYAGPAMCLLILQAVLSAQRKTWILTWLLAVSGFLFLIMSPTFLRANQGFIQNEYYKDLFINSPNADFLYWVFLIPLVLFIFPALKYVVQNKKPAILFNANAFSFVSLALYQSCILALIVLPWWSHVLQSPVHDLAMRFKNKTETVVQWGVHLPSFATYRQKESPKREPQDSELALVKNSSPYWQAHWEVLDTSGPLAIVQSSKVARQP
jgi:4-amino-4-deoxy-L-arabinose transferase-like glycosyltransferase